MKTIPSYKLGTVLARMESFRRNAEGPSAKKNKSRHVCAVVRGNPTKARCISMAINHTTPRGHFHAEESVESVLRSLGTDTRYNVVVARFISNGHLAQSDPCMDCATMLNKYADVIHRIYYTTADPAIVEYGSPVDILAVAVAKNYRTFWRANSE